jgi:hypothetical protein
MARFSSPGSQARDVVVFVPSAVTVPSVGCATSFGVEVARQDARGGEAPLPRQSA